MKNPQIKISRKILARRRRQSVPLRLVAVGETDLQPDSSVTLRFTASEKIAIAAHQNLAIVFIALIILRLIDLLRKGYIEDTVEISATDYLLGILSAVLAMRLVWITPKLMTWMVDQISTAGRGTFFGLSKAIIAWMIRNLRYGRAGSAVTLLSYAVILWLLLLAGQQLTGRFFQAAPLFVWLSLLVALIVPWIMCFDKTPRFGDFERPGNPKEAVQLYSTAFGKTRSGALDLNINVVKSIVDTLHGRVKNGTDFKLLLLADILNPCRRSTGASSTALEGDQSQIRLSRIFLRQEIETAPAVATFAAISCIMPGMTMIIICMVFQLFMAMELAVAAIIWAIFSLAQLYEILRHTPQSLRLSENDEAAFDAPLLPNPGERETLNAGLEERYKGLVKMVGGILFGIAIAVLLGLLAVDAARTDSRGDCLLFSTCTKKPSACCCCTAEEPTKKEQSTQS